MSLTLVWASDRRAVALELSGNSGTDTGPYYLVGPDNGTFYWRDARAKRPASGDARVPFAYRLPSVSQTFHGRDIFAPAAAHLAAGVDLAELGPKVAPETLVSLPLGRAAPSRMRAAGRLTSSTPTSLGT